MKKSKISLLFKIIIFLLFFYNVLSIIRYINKYSFNDGVNISRGVVTSVKTTNDKTSLLIKSNKLILSYINKDTSLKPGDVIHFDFHYKNVYNQGIFNSFNYRNYLKSVNINNVIEIDSYKKVDINFLHKLKSLLIDKINSRRSRAYISTFLLSDKSRINDGVKTSFYENGIAHMLSVSGFHVIFLLSFLKTLLRKLKLKNSVCLIIMLLISFTYLFLSDFSIALYRAFLLYFVNYFNSRYCLKLNKYLIFLFVLNVCLCNQPFLIYNSGFWYTFILSFFLIAYQSKYSSFRKLITLSIYMFLVSLPLTIYYNFSFNLLSIVYNMFFIYVVCYLMFPLSFLATFFTLTDILLYRISIIFENINLRLSSINNFQIVIPKINIATVLVLYILLFLFIRFGKVKYFFGFLAILIGVKISIYFDVSSYLYFLNVQQGDMSVYVSRKHKNVTIFDTGGLQNNKYLFSNIEIFLHSIGVERISHLVLSHGDFDHMGEAINLVNNFKVEKVIFNCGEYNDLEGELIKVLDKKKIKYYSCIKELNIDDSKLYFLQTKEYDNENDNSNVIYTELDGYKFMFMGDASITTEKEILNKYNLSNIDVLKVGHHGSKTSSGKDFINEINPKYSVISVGKNNRYGHPNKEVLDNLNESKIYRTDIDGSIMFKIKNNKLKIETFAP